MVLSQQAQDAYLFCNCAVDQFADDVLRNVVTVMTNKGLTYRTDPMSDDELHEWVSTFGHDRFGDSCRVARSITILFQRLNDAQPILDEYEERFEAAEKRVRELESHIAKLEKLLDYGGFSIE